MVKRVAGLGGETGRTCAGRQGACLSAARAPQFGKTPLHTAAMRGYAAVVGQLLAAGADKDATDKVRKGGGVVDREVSMGSAQLFVSSCLCSCEKSLETC